MIEGTGRKGRTSWTLLIALTEATRVTQGHLVLRVRCDPQPTAPAPATMCVIAPHPRTTPPRVAWWCVEPFLDVGIRATATTAAHRGGVVYISVGFHSIHAACRAGCKRGNDHLQGLLSRHLSGMMTPGVEGWVFSYVQAAYEACWQCASSGKRPGAIHCIWNGGSAGGWQVCAPARTLKEAPWLWDCAESCEP